MYSINNIYILVKDHVAGPGNQRLYIDRLKEDAMLNIEELPTEMNDRNEWKLGVMECSTW